jgi:hypothetical protein
MRKFHRTMDQAFPYGADYGCAIKRQWKPSLLSQVFQAVAILTFCAAMVALMLAYFDVLVP